MYKIIGADQKEYGPVSAEQLRQWISEGRVNGQTKIQPDGATEWKMASEIAEFSGLFPKAPPAPPSPLTPIKPLPASPANSQIAVWSLITGIASLLCCCGWYLVAPTAIVLGAIALSQLKNHPELTGGGFAIAGIVLGIVAILMYGAMTAVAILSPDFMQNIQNAMQQ